jgi:hypothetical protein
MLGTLEPDQKKDWKAYIAPLVHAYNCTRHETTGYSPFFLMFNRHPRLPVDLAFGIHREGQDHKSYHDFVKAMKERLEYAYGVASSTISGSQKEQKRKFDLKVRGAVVGVGDRVLVRNVGLRGKHKIADRWSPDAYIVVCQPNNDVPVYVVVKENGHGSARTLHRNMLLPLASVPPAHLVSKEKPGDVPNRYSTGGGTAEGGQGTEDQGREAEKEKPVIPPPASEGPGENDVDPLDSMETEEEPNDGALPDTADEIEIVPGNPAQDPQDPDEMSQDGSSDSSFEEESGSDEETAQTRPQRNRKPPGWMQGTSWQFMARAMVPKRQCSYRRPLKRQFANQFMSQVDRVNRKLLWRALAICPR